jgi:hypothetical protein
MRRWVGYVAAAKSVLHRFVPVVHQFSLVFRDLPRYTAAHSRANSRAIMARISHLHAVPSPRYERLRISVGELKFPLNLA